MCRLIVNWPKRIPEGREITVPVSTRRIYHTILDAIGMLPEGVENLDPTEIHGLTLMENVFGRDPEQQTAFLGDLSTGKFCKSDSAPPA